MKLLNGLLVLFITLALVNANGAENLPQQYWPTWRGPLQTGVSSTGSYLSSWTTEENVLWKVDLPGIGCSTPAVFGDKIFVTSGSGEKDALLAFDWDGEQIWSNEVGSQIKGKHRNGSGSNPSPVTDGKFVYCYFKSGNLAAIDFTGKTVWKTNLQQRYGNVSLFWDLGNSPVLTRDSVIVAVMHAGDSYVVSLDKKTGNINWKIDRNYETPVEGDHGYSTPILIERDGVESIIVWGGEHLTAYDVDSGKLLWTCGGFNPDNKTYWVTVSSIVIVDDVAVVPYGRGARLAGIKLGGSGDVTESHRLWTVQEKGSFVPTPVAHEGRVYVLRDSGQLVCVDPKTGDTIWEGQFPRRSTKYYSSPVIADGKVYAAREDGVIMVANIKDGFKFLGENDMQQRLVACPVPVGNKILIRGEEQLFCIGK